MMSLYDETSADEEDAAPAAGKAVVQALSFSTSTIVTLFMLELGFSCVSSRARVQLTILKRFCCDFSRFWSMRLFTFDSGCCDFFMTISLASSFVIFAMCSEMSSP